MRDLTIDEMDMVFGGSGQSGSGTNGSVYGPVDRDYPSDRDVLNNSPYGYMGSTPGNPNLHTGPSIPIGGGIRVNIPIGRSQ